MLKLLRDLAFSIHLVHTSRLVLCDLKPENILVDDDDTLILCDFGSVSWKGYIAGRGTRPYSDGYYDAYPASDMFSYGMIISEILLEHWSSTLSLPEILSLLQDTEPIIREHLKRTGLTGDIVASQVLRLAADCMRDNMDERPSALVIIHRLDDLMSLCCKQPSHQVQDITTMGMKLPRKSWKGLPIWLTIGALFIASACSFLRYASQFFNCFLLKTGLCCPLGWFISTTTSRS
ncbi:unnamed protein product [Cuscuta campestris]|uniref:Protein kinase domain-containing protein n=1 Tax=Cuscuta campestris TaxID=132261 RepID=A0A484N006_9ASTE|nr:unnamed protein product [Cuscuta campestris]